MPIFTDSPFIYFDKRNRFMLKVKLKKEHGFSTTRAFNRIISKRKKYVIAPCNHVKIYMSVMFGYGPVKTVIFFTVPCIDTVITNHFEMLFRDMPDQPFNELHDRDFFNN